MKKMKYDPITEGIKSLLEKIPRAGKYLAKLYLWKPMMFNYMLVGASGTVLSWLLYEGVFRVLLFELPFGTFLAMVIVTIIVYFWNFTWNKKWSLKVDSQIQGMNRIQLQELRRKINQRLRNL